MTKDRWTRPDARVAMPPAELLPVAISSRNEVWQILPRNAAGCVEHTAYVNTAIAPSLRQFAERTGGTLFAPGGATMSSCPGAMT
jgi:hypothetical protein